MRKSGAEVRFLWKEKVQVDYGRFPQALKERKIAEHMAALGFARSDIDDLEQRLEKPRETPEDRGELDNAYLRYQNLWKKEEWRAFLDCLPGLVENESNPGEGWDILGALETSKDRENRDWLQCLMRVILTFRESGKELTTRYFTLWNEALFPEKEEAPAELSQTTKGPPIAVLEAAAGKALVIRQDNGEYWLTGTLMDLARFLATPENGGIKRTTARQLWPHVKKDGGVEIAWEVFRKSLSEAKWSAPTPKTGGNRK